MNHRLWIALWSGSLGLVVAACSAVASPPVKAPPRTSAVPPSAPSAQPPLNLRVAPVEELVELDLEERLGAVSARGAAWVPGWPLAVNRDFDMALALSLDVGAGLAAAKRRNGNAELIRRLERATPLDPEARLRALCDKRADRSAALSGTTVRVYAMLYGERVARLRIVVERAGVEPPEPRASVSEARPLPEFEDGAVLSRAFDSELGRALDLVAIAADAPKQIAGRCAIGDNAYVAGDVILRDAQRIVLRASESPTSLISCPLDAFTEKPDTGS